MTVKPEDIANIRGMKMENGRVTMDLEVARQLMLAMASSAVAMLEDAKAPNFIEMELMAANNDIRHTTVTIAYCDRPTPMDIISKLRGELVRIYNTEALGWQAEARIEKLLKELGYEEYI